LFKQRHPRSSTQVFDLAPGFTIAGGKVEAAVLRKELDPAEVRRTYAEEIARANRYGSVKQEDVDEVVELLARNVDFCRDYLLSYPGDYRFLVRFRNSHLAAVVAKDGSRLAVTAARVEDRDASSYDLTFTTRLAYLRWSLTKPYADEILFVGSGGIFDYPSRAKAKLGLHAELRTVLRRHEKRLTPRREVGFLGRQLGGLKQLLRKALWREKPPLYDLDTWTVYGSD
jgi:hypothetical protein